MNKHYVTLTVVFLGAGLGCLIAVFIGNKDAPLLAVATFVSSGLFAIADSITRSRK